MIIIAISIYILANLLPKWILKEKYTNIREQFSWKLPLLKLSGLLISISLAFLTVTIFSISTQKAFLENKNAIHGLKFNATMESFGFEDGMKIIAINNQPIYKVTDIIPTIILDRGKTKVNVEQSGINRTIVLGSRAKSDLLTAQKFDFIFPIQDQNKKALLLSYENHNFSDIVFEFKMLWRQAKNLLLPNRKQIAQQGGFSVINLNGTAYGYCFTLAMNLILLFILNLLPLPGFSMGNAILSIIEIKNKKYFSTKKKSIFKIITIAIVILFLFINLY